MGARDALAEHPALEPELARITDPGALQTHRAARRLDRPRLIPIAVADGFLAALISSAAQEVADLILERLLKDQPRSQPTGRLNRILLAVDPGQHLIQFYAKFLARDYLLHAGVPPSLG